MMIATWRGMDLLGAAMNQRMIVCPRAGPTLTMVNFAPVNCAMRCTYSRARFGKSDGPEPTVPPGRIVGDLGDLINQHLGTADVVSAREIHHQVQTRADHGWCETQRAG